MGTGISSVAMQKKFRAESMTITQPDFDAVIFDLDGVLIDTARIHAAAWKAVFDSFLGSWAQRHGLTLQPFAIGADYLNYVDGRLRADGIRSFLGTRGISLPEGSEHDSEEMDTVHALGKRKTRLFLKTLEKGIDPAPGAETLLKKLRETRMKTAIGSSSKNTAAILSAAKIEHHFDACVDGLDAEALNLAGKPDPALFLEIARRLNVEPSRVVLFEDALAGVEAGRRGGFGCVVGIDRGSQSAGLREHGADVIIKSLRNVSVEEH